MRIKEQEFSGVGKIKYQESRKRIIKFKLYEYWRIMDEK